MSENRVSRCLGLSKYLVCYTLFVVHAVVIVVSRGQVEMNFLISGSQGRT